MFVIGKMHVLKISFLELDPWTVEDAIEKGMGPKCGLGGHQGMVLGCESGEVECQWRENDRNARKEDLPEPWIEVVRGEHAPEVPEKLVGVQTTIRVRATEQVAFVFVGGAAVGGAMARWGEVHAVLSMKERKNVVDPTDFEHPIGEAGFLVRDRREDLPVDGQELGVTPVVDSL
jgi:hypothetical protein